MKDSYCKSWERYRADPEKMRAHYEAIRAYNKFRNVYGYAPFEEVPTRAGDDKCFCIHYESCLITAARKNKNTVCPKDCKKFCEKELDMTEHLMPKETNSNRVYLPLPKL